MTKGKKDKKGKKAGKTKLPKALRASGDAVAEWAQSPIARELLAAGLVAVASAIADNKKLRAKAKRGADDAGEITTDAAAMTSQLGAMLAAAATDAAQRLFAPEEPTRKKRSKPKKAPPAVAH